MIKVIVDTNIAFSAILNSSGRIGKVLFNSRGIFHFVSCKYLLTEIDLLFVGLTLELKGRLWTGDKKLIRGLTANGFNQFFTTSQLSSILDEIGRKI